MQVSASLRAPSDLDVQILTAINKVNALPEKNVLDAIDNILQKDAKAQQDHEEQPEIYPACHGLNREITHKNKIKWFRQGDRYRFLTLPAILILNDDGRDTQKSLKVFRALIEKADYPTAQALWLAVSRNSPSLMAIVTYMLIIGVDHTYYMEETPKWGTTEFLATYRSSYFSSKFKAGLAIRAIESFFQQKQEEKLGLPTQCSEKFEEACKYDHEYIYQFVITRLELHVNDILEANLKLLQFLTREYLLRVKEFRHDTYGKVYNNFMGLWKQIPVGEKQFFKNQQELSQFIESIPKPVVSASQVSAYNGDDVKATPPPAPRASVNEADQPAASQLASARQPSAVNAAAMRSSPVYQRGDGLKEPSALRAAGAPPAESGFVAVNPEPALQEPKRPVV